MSDNTYKELKGNIYCGIGIWNEKQNRMVWKWDCGKESFSEAEKDTKIPKNTINQCCLGRTEYGGIYHWKYIE